MKSSLLLLAFFLFFGIAPLQAQETPKTLLWRITGNHFSKPCYLYGTMHSRDKRVYFLGDSVYNAIGQSDGFAMEIDPGDLIDTIINSNESNALDIEYRQLVENDLIKKGPEYYKERSKVFDSIMKKMRLRYDQLPARYFNRLERAYRRRMRNDMKTALDLYLFDLAKKQGKIVTSVEDITDQTSLTIKEDKQSNFDEDDFLNKQEKRYADIDEWMIENYADAELDKIEEFSRLSNTKKNLSLVLFNRNDKMARRIDSLGNIRSSFCAVGAAHLPGDSGVINLLRKKGFTVTPVFSSKKIEPGDIVIENQQLALINITDLDSNYIVQMPGKPTWLTNITQKLFVKTYKELSNEILLMCGVYEDGKTYLKTEMVVDEIKTYFSRYADLRFYNSKKISRQQLDGYEINLRNKEGYIRLHLFCSNGKTYLFGAGSKDKDSVNSVRCENYLASYQMILNKPRRETSMISFECPDKAFSVLMPVLPKKENVKGDLTYTKEDVTLFSSFDVRKKINYLVMIKEPFKGYFLGYDSSLFLQSVDEIRKGIRQRYIEEENVLLDGYPALKIKITGESDNKNQRVYSVMAIRNNRFYNITVRGLAIQENDQLFEKYISSFHFIPYLPVSIEKRTGGNNLFTVMATSPIEISQNKNTADAKNKPATELVHTDYFAFDSSTSMSYAITSMALDKYYWTADINSFLNEYTTMFFNSSLAEKNVFNNDSLIYNKATGNGNLKARELLIKNRVNRAYSRMRILQYADSLFMLTLKGDKDLLTNEIADTFFASFSFVNENPPTGIFKSKTEQLIHDLSSTDSSKQAAAVQALKNGFKFPHADLQLLLNALLDKYSAEKIDADIAELLTETITPYAGDEVTKFIKINYPLLKGKREDIRMHLFNMLSATPSSTAYSMLKDFFLNDPPVPADYDVALTYFNKNPALAASLFPDVSTKIKEAVLAPVLLDLANSLIDSNRLQLSALNEFGDDIKALAKKMLRDYKDMNSESFYVPHTSSILQLLIKINDKKAADLIDDFIDVQNSNLTSVIILSKIKNKQPVEPKVFDNYCELPTHLIALYDELDKIDGLSYFKGKYTTQKAFAEAFVTIFTNRQISENVPKNFDLAAIKEDSLNRVMTRFYVFKIKCFFKYQTESYTGIIGPFSANDSNLSIKEGKEKFAMYQVKFSADNIDAIFDDYINKVRVMEK